LCGLALGRNSESVMSKTLSKSVRHSSRSVEAVNAVPETHKRVIAAAGAAIRRTLKQHKTLGESIVVWKDGKVVTVSAGNIKA